MNLSLTKETDNYQLNSLYSEWSSYEYDAEKDSMSEKKGVKEITQPTKRILEILGIQSGGRKNQEYDEDI